jgi:ribosomal protein S8E
MAIFQGKSTRSQSGARNKTYRGKNKYELVIEPT